MKTHFKSHRNTHSVWKTYQEEVLLQFQVLVKKKKKKNHQENKTIVLGPQFLQKHEIVLGMCFCAPPRYSREESVTFRFFITTDYSYSFMCLCRKKHGVFCCFVLFLHEAWSVTCSLPLWLYTLFM